MAGFTLFLKRPFFVRLIYTFIDREDRIGSGLGSGFGKKFGRLVDGFFFSMTLMIYTTLMFFDSYSRYYHCFSAFFCRD